MVYIQNPFPPIPHYESIYHSVTYTHVQQALPASSLVGYIPKAIYKYKPFINLNISNMKHQNIIRFYVLIASIIYFINLTTLAAQVTNATNTYNGALTTYDVPVCPTCNTVDDLQSLNCDMHELEPNSTSTNFEEKLYGIVWTGGEGFDVSLSAQVYNQSYFALSSSLLLGSWLSTQIPAAGSFLDNIGATAHEADIAVGKYHDAIAGTDKFFAIVVYQSLGDIYFESYDLSVTGTGVTITYQHQPYAVITPPCSLTCNIGGQWRLSGGAGNAYYPHVDIIVEGGGAVYTDAKAVKYVVSWQEWNSSAGKFEIMNAEGSLFQTPSLVTGVGFGTFPDIAGVTNIQPGSSAMAFDDDMVYTAYIEDNSGDLVLAERKWNTPTVNTTVTLETGSGSSNDIYYPRLAAPVTYDFSNTSNTEPVSIVAASVKFSPNTYTSVESYYYDDPAGSGNVTAQTVSEYNSNTFFSATPYNASMPVITGAGVLNSNTYSSAGGTPFNEYPIVFYSDLTWNGSSVVAGNGDLYGSNADPATLTPSGFYNGNFSEVNFEVYNSAFDMFGRVPLLAASTSNNSNFDLLTTYYDGQKIYWKDMGGVSSYGNYKPGKTTSIEKTGKPGYAVYPNPVKDRLNITNADAADYTISDVTGRSVSTGILSGSKSVVDASSLVPGVYILYISKEGHTEQVKFVKQ